MIKSARKKILRIGIVGAGLIGNKRAKAMRAVGGSRLVAVADVDARRAEEFGKMYGCDSYADWRKVTRHDDLDVVIVAVPNRFVAPIVLDALRHKKHVLSEKPFGRNVAEAEAMLKEGREQRRLIKVGFNHRFHGAIWKARQLFDRGAVGKLLFIRARYGHGGRLGMEKEWRFQKRTSGGGELLDQGVHIIDLCRWFGGDFDRVYGLAQTKFWHTDLDDNAFVLMHNKHVTASFHVSTTNWKNIFSFELFGDKGFLTIDGKGGSYGEETLTFGRRPERFGIPTIERSTFPGDVSWETEWKNFLDAIRRRSPIIGGAIDGVMANKIVQAVYRSSKIGRAVRP